MTTLHVHLDEPDRLTAARVRVALIQLARRHRDHPGAPDELRPFWHALLLAIEDADRARLGLPPLGGGATIEHTCGSPAPGTPDARDAEPNIPPRTTGSGPTRDHDQGPRSPRKARDAGHHSEDTTRDTTREAPRGPLSHD